MCVDAEVVFSALTLALAPPAVLVAVCAAPLAAVVVGAVEAPVEAEPCVEAIGVVAEPLAEPEACACGVAVWAVDCAVLVALLVTGAVLTCA